MTYPARTVDACQALLKSRGWSVGDASYLRNGNIIWLVTCGRGQERITAEGESQLEAWQTAVEAS